MSRYAKGLLIAGIVAILVTAIGLTLMALAPENTSTMMRVGVFSALYGIMADIVVARLYGEFRKTDLLKKRDALQ